MTFKEKLKHYRLNEAEFETIKELLGREPEGLEWPLFSALWSEHCSYKSSKRHLKKFAMVSPRVLQGFGENAGVIDLGEGESVAFKMESHNHPSFIEPYQGAATGVGGILRDIFTMGARPMALANYLCFGEPSAERMPSLVDGVVRGIGGYGNCVGVPTVTGQTEFHKSYNGNILVNAFALGYFGKNDPILTSAAKGKGNLVVYVGAKTGKDGVHGASMASESFDEDSESKKPTVQIGDPFFEKLLIESCIEVMAKDLVVAIQDMGAAGLTSSSFEMASKGQVGLTLHLDKVPSRDTGITPEEILLSESQERMLLICEPSKLIELKAVFEHWDLDAEVVGEVLEERKIQLFWKGDLLTEIDPDMLTENAPYYDREHSSWGFPRAEKEFPSESFSQALSEKTAEETLKTQLSSVEGCSRSWVFDQYDQRVGASTVRDATHSVAVIMLPESKRPLGITLGCRPYIMRTDARLGGADAVLAPAFELSLKGFEPLAVTDCLNFGNPERPKLMTELVASIEGMAEACKSLETPVISGNVSLYNETNDENVTSTPSTGVVGLKSSIEGLPADTFTGGGDDAIYWIQLGEVWCGGLSLENSQADKAGYFSGELQIDLLHKSYSWIQEQVNSNRILASRMVGKFGLAYALSRMCLGGLGANASGLDLEVNLEKTLFAELLYSALVQVPQAVQLQDVPVELQSFLKVQKIGQTGGASLQIGSKVNLPLEELKSCYQSGWEKYFAVLA